MARRQALAPAQATRAPCAKQAAGEAAGGEREQPGGERARERQVGVTLLRERLVRVPAVAGEEPELVQAESGDADQRGGSLRRWCPAHPAAVLQPSQARHTTVTRS